MPHRRAAFRRAVATLLVGVAGLFAGGCTGDDPGLRPTPGTTQSGATHTPTATPTPTFNTPAPTPGVLAALPDGVKPERPSALDEPASVDAATAVGVYFAQLVPYSQNTLDATDLASLSHAECNFCASVQQQVAEASEYHEHWTGGGLRISGVQGQEVDPGRFFAVQFAMDEGESARVSKAGTVVSSNPATRYAVDMVVLYENGRWTVRAVEFDEEPA